jgi:transposase
MTKKRRSFTAEFKLEAAQLVTLQGYSVAEASRSLGVSDVLLGRWVRQLKQESAGITPKSKALTPEQQRIKELEARIDRLEREKVILKKATVSSTGQCNILRPFNGWIYTYDHHQGTRTFSSAETRTLE